MGGQHPDPIYWTSTDEIRTANRRVRPHVVLIGAGASRATFPSGDGNGRALPLMNDLVELLGLGSSFDDAGIAWKGQNFEDLYAQISADDRLSGLRRQVEETVESYFRSLELPPEPTIYDRLVLSLRDQDVIATFNWDPFLIQAWRRNAGRVPSLPYLLFLHGNVLSAFCPQDKVKGVRGASCSKCGRPFVPTKLLYPIANKDYTSDPGIASMWDALRQVVPDALFLTIFGYGAPASDRAAVEILSSVWGDPAGERFMEQVEIIDIRPEEQLRIQWRSFIHSHHFDVVTEFSESWIANHPRRTVEAYHAQYVEARMVEGNPLPIALTSLEDLWSWFEELSDHER